MPLPTFDKADDVPAPFKDEYEEKDGKWHPKPQGEDVTALKETLRKERESREEHEKKAKELQKKITEEERKRAAGERGITDEQLKKMREEVRADLEGEYKPFKDSSAKLADENRVLKLDTSVKTTMAKKEVGVRAERMDTLWKLVSDRFDLTDDGKPMVKGHAGTSVEQYLAGDVKKEFPEFFIGTQASGGGAGGSHEGGGSPGKTTEKDLFANPAAALQAARATK